MDAYDSRAASPYQNVGPSDALASGNGNTNEEYGPGDREITRAGSAVDPQQTRPGRYLSPLPRPSDSN